MPELRVHNFAMSLDGFVAGPDQSLDNPLGAGGRRLHEWAVATRSGRRMTGMEGGDTGLDDELSVRVDEGIGATIMGRNMFGPVRGPWGLDSLPDGYECVELVCSPAVAHARLRGTAS